MISSKIDIKRENCLFMPELWITEKIYISSFTICQNIFSLIENLKFMSELRVDKKIHISTPIACQNIP